MLKYGLVIAVIAGAYAGDFVTMPPARPGTPAELADALNHERDFRRLEASLVARMDALGMPTDKERANQVARQVERSAELQQSADRMQAAVTAARVELDRW